MGIPLPLGIGFKIPRNGEINIVKNLLIAILLELMPVNSSRFSFQVCVAMGLWFATKNLNAAIVCH